MMGLLGTQQAQPQQTAQGMMDQIMVQKMRLDQNKAYEMVAKYNRNPKSVKDTEIPMVLEAAERYGYDTSSGRDKDTPGFLEAIGSFIGGGIDAVLLDLLKDEWYSNRRTQGWKGAGKIAGLVASLYTPASFMAGTKLAVTGATGAAKALSIGKNSLLFAAKYLTAPGLAAGTKRALGIALAVRAGNGVAATGMPLVKGWARTMAGQARVGGAAMRGGTFAGNLSLKLGGAEGFSFAKMPWLSNIGKVAPFVLPVYGGMRLLGTLGRVGNTTANPYEQMQMPEMPRMPMAQ